MKAWKILKWWRVTTCEPHCTMIILPIIISYRSGIEDATYRTHIIMYIKPNQHTANVPLVSRIMHFSVKQQCPLFIHIHFIWNSYMKHSPSSNCKLQNKSKNHCHFEEWSLYRVLSFGPRIMPGMTSGSGGSCAMLPHRNDVVLSQLMDADDASM